MFKTLARLVIFAGLALTAQAATLSLQPASGSFGIGQNISASIIVSSPSQAMNAVSGVLSFPADQLEVTSISKSGSIVGLWVQEPSFSNHSGTVTFEGIALNPGFTGSAGRVLGVNFRVKRAGSAALTFVSPAILANDGQGTSILSSAPGASWTVAEGITPPPAPVVPSSNALTIRSETHPDSNKWYRSGTARFSWSLPAGVTSVRLGLSSKPATPSVVYDSGLEEREITDLEDGVWYFQAQYRLASGEWSDVATYRFQVDTVSPSNPSVALEPRAEPSDPVLRLALSASDETSGVDYYEIKIDGQLQPVWRGKRGEVYETAPLAPGEHTIAVRVFDRAGNTTSDSLAASVAPLLTPTWTDYPARLSAGEPLVARGRSYPNIGLIITYQRGDDPAQTLAIKSDENGAFSFTAPERLAAGTYRLSARVLDDRGASSLPSEEIKINVQAPGWWTAGVQIITLLSVLIPLVALVFALAFLLHHNYHRFRILRRKLRKEIHEAEESISKAFDLLLEDLEKQLALLEKTKTKRELTKEESKILTRLRKNLRAAEKYIKKEVEELEKEVK